MCRERRKPHRRALRASAAGGGHAALGFFSGRSVEVYSRALEERILSAADNAEAPEADQVVYRAAELTPLVRRSPEALRRFHTDKKILDGQIVR